MFRDVRMRGFQRRTSVADATAWVEGLEPAGRVEAVALADAADRILAEEVVSAFSVPAFARSAMDGWALCAEETFGAAETDPIGLRVVGTSLPGRPYAGTITRGEAVRIMTGAALPEGADAVLRAEDGRQEDERLQVRAAVPAQKHVGAVGEDILAGRPVLVRGRRLRPPDVGLLSSIGVGHPVVHTQPRVCLLVTGDELLPPGATPEGVRIVDSNSPMLRALVQRDGGLVTRARMLPDDEPVLRAALQEAAAANDVVIVIGGSSVGEEDHAPRLLATLGDLAIHGIAMRPAAPTGMGTIGSTPVFLLPGNPVSCLSAYDFFAGRLIHRFSYRPGPYGPYECVEGVLTRKITSVLGRMDYVRVRVSAAGVTPLMSRGASILSSVTEADGYVLVPQDSEGYADGRAVQVYLY